MAERASISTEAVSALERGTRKAPQRQTLELLLTALEAAEEDRAALTLAAVRPSLPRARAPRAEQTPIPAFVTPAMEMTSFLGRSDEVAALLDLCRSSRLTTIVGPGGIGKSRLALEVAREAASRFDATLVVGLAPVLAGTSVLPAFAAAFGLHDSGPTDLEEQLISAAGRRSMLLVVDNCEHVLDELAGILHRLLLACAGVRVLATSREPVAIDGERIFRLAPLAITYAVDVFIDRASANGYDPSENAEDLRVVAEICDRLDRMPLAIELAASCTDVIALEGILERLRDRDGLPARPKRTALPQHRSLEALVEWSYDSLQAGDATVFRRLAPLIGGCRLDDAQAVLAFDGVSSDDVVYSLFRLHERSLLDADRARQPRFQMLETIRDFANRRLAGAERASVRARYAEHYLGVVAGLDETLRGAHQGAAIDRISAEMMNVRAVIPDIRPDAPFASSAVAALGALSHFWLRTGGLTEGSALYAAIDFAAFPPSRELASALAGAAFVELNRQAFERAFAYAVEARRVAQSIGDAWFDVYAGIAQHTVASVTGAFTVAEPFDPLYDRARELGDPWLIGSAASRMAALADPADLATRIRFLEFGLACARRSGDVFAVQAMSLALAHTTAQPEPLRSAGYVRTIWEELQPSHQVCKAYCVECFSEIAERLERLDDAAFLTGVALSISRRSGLTDAARSWLEAQRQRLEPQRAALIAAGENAVEPEATMRIESFVASLRGA